MRTAFLFFLLFSLEASAQSAASLIVKGNNYYRQSEFALAEVQYREALEKEPRNTTAMFNLANALQKQQKFSQAARLLGELAGTTTDTGLRASAWYNQGVAYTKMKNLEESIESYKKALRLHPEDKLARENLQKALLELKKKNQQNQQKQKQDPKMSQKEAEQKLKLLQQKEKELQQKQQSKNKKQGGGQAQDW